MDNGILETEEDQKDKPRKLSPNIFQKILINKSKNSPKCLKIPARNNTINTFNFNRIYSLNFYK